ncbi:MAG: hypothetical protein IJ475_01810 [Bacilli bacterium]|nr:hypothetical protein [Bacilli bacterium]
MNEKWIEFLENAIFEDINTVLGLIMFDNKIQGTNFDINDTIEYLKYSNQLNFSDNSDAMYILEGDSNILINLLGCIFDLSCVVYIFQNNLGFNKWIVLKFFEFCEINAIENKNIIKFSEVIDKTIEPAILVGSEAFVNEIYSMLNINCKKIIL